MKRILALAVFLALAFVVRADDQKWTLSDGTTVTVLKVLSQNATHVTVRCPEGIVQIDKRRLPEALQVQYPYDQSAAAAAESPKAHAPGGAAVRRPTTGNASRHGSPHSGPLEIVAVRATERATAYVTIASRADSLIDLEKGALVGVNANGSVFPVLRYTNSRGDVLKRIRLLPNATKEVGVVFDIPEPELGDIISVHWKQ